MSNTPLQALTLLNDAAMIEAAQALGREFAAAPGTPAERIVALFRRCLTRRPTEAESAALRRFYERQRQHFAKATDDAAKVAGPGSEAPEQAAWTALARALFNLDEMIVKE